MQGGINSPDFFNIFINGLIVKLRNSNLGCYIADIYCGCLFFADDILFLSASFKLYQLMLDLCTDFAKAIDLKFHNIKSHLLQIGLSPDVLLLNLKLGGVELHWVNDFKYF